MTTLPKQLLECGAREHARFVLWSHFVHDQSRRRTIFWEQFFELVARQPIKLRVVRVHRLLAAMSAPPSKLREALQERDNEVPPNPQVLHELLSAAASPTQYDEGVPEISWFPRQANASPNVARRHDKRRSATNDIDTHTARKKLEDAGADETSPGILTVCPRNSRCLLYTSDAADE